MKSRIEFYRLGDDFSSEMFVQDMLQKAIQSLTLTFIYYQLVIPVIRNQNTHAHTHKIKIKNKEKTE